MNQNLTSRQFLAKSIGVAATLTLICLMASVIVQVQAQEEHEALTIRVSINRSSCTAGEVIIISGWVGCTKCGVADPAAVVSVDVAGPRGAVLSTSVGTGSDGRFSVQVDTTALYPGTYWVTASVVQSSLRGTWVQTSSRTAFTVVSSTTTAVVTATSTRTYPTATAIVTITYPTATAPVTVTVTKEPTVVTARVPPAKLVSDVAAPVAVVVTATLGSLAIAVSQGLSLGGWSRNVVETINTGVKTVKGGVKSVKGDRFKGLISAPEVDIRGTRGDELGAGRAEITPDRFSAGSKGKELTAVDELRAARGERAPVGSSAGSKLGTAEELEVGPTSNLPMTKEDEANLKLILEGISKGVDMPKELRDKIPDLRQKLNTEKNTWYNDMTARKHDLDTAIRKLDEYGNEVNRINEELNDWKTLPERKAWLEDRKEQLERYLIPMKKDEIDGPPQPRGYKLGYEEKGLRGQFELSEALHNDADSSLTKLGNYLGIRDTKYL